MRRTVNMRGGTEGGGGAKRGGPRAGEFREQENCGHVRERNGGIFNQMFALHYGVKVLPPKQPWSWSEISLFLAW